MVQSSRLQVKPTIDVEGEAPPPTRRRQSALWRFVRFGITGGCNASIDIFTLNILLWRFPTHNLALLVLYNTFAYALGATNSYLLNKYWTFRRGWAITGDELIRFITVNVIGILCNNGIFWVVAKEQSLYPFFANSLLLANIAKVSAIIGTQAGQNLLRPTDFWDKNYHDNKQSDITIWKNMDYLVCAAKQRGMYVEMDVSAFSWFIISQKHDAYTVSYWKPFLAAVGKHYNNQSSIAFYSILGEPEAPKTIDAMNKVVDFYRAVTDDLRAVDGNHLIMAGGFNHMEDESPAIPWWHKIYALPNNDIVGLKTYSQDDLNLMPTIAAYAKQLGEPMVDEEFGLPQNQGDATATGNIYNGLQISRAEFYSDVYTIGKTNGITGFIFWNLGCKTGGTDYEVSPDTPAVWQVIQQHAPGKLAAPGSQPACPSS